MSEWEYHVSVETKQLSSKQDETALVKELNHKGDEGWELTAGFQSASGEERVVLVFKRQKSMMESALQ